MRTKEESKPLMTDLPQQANISLAIKSYADIFSDFDRRPLSIRALSVDFLHEAKRAAVDKEEGLELNLLIPEKERDFRSEATIKTRLKEHFSKHFFLLQKENSSLTKKGAILTVIGILIMLFAGYIIITLAENTKWVTFILLLLEPAGWFFFWEGLDIMVFKPKETKKELDFYRKLSRAEIKFISY